jgi:putative Flp pilus-assembly TadE/G-like protein
MPGRLSLGDEHGVVTVMFALMLPTLLLFAVIAVDAGNWFVHKRHLQTQADAAALAGAAAFSFPSCDNTKIRSAALRYSGVGDGTVAYNDKYPTVDGGRLHAVVNGPNYFGQSQPGEADLVGNPNPCQALMVDVKMTENDLPYFFGSGIVERINAEARVALFQLASTDGALPLGVQEASPRRVRAYVVDETTGATLAQATLSAHGSGGGLARFDNQSAPLSFTPPAGVSNLGVRLAMTGATSTTCGDPLVTCYDTAAPNQGLAFLRSWSDQPAIATNGAPVLRSVSLSPGTCPNGSFGSSPVSCTMEAVARVSFNSAVNPADLAGPDPAATVALDYDGTPVAMTYSPTTDAWRASITVAPGASGPRNVDVTGWTQRVGTVAGKDCTKKKNDPCAGTFAGIEQRTFYNDPTDQASRGGPVATLDVRDNSTGALVSDLQQCSTTHPDCTVPLVFEVAIKGSLGLDSAADPPRSLRVSGSGSQNQSLDCDPGRGFVDEIAYGCTPSYAINTGASCSSPTSPPSCVPVQTGTATNKPAQGLNIRFLCAPAGNPGNCGGSAGNYDGKPSVCPPAGSFGHNNWPDYPSGDPRVVPVLVVPFGTFEASGNTRVPIIDFAAFYVTGYTGKGGGFDNPCATSGDTFVPGTENDNGVISGHFVKFVQPNSGGASSDDCETTDIGQCVAVLVK